MTTAAAMNTSIWPRYSSSASAPLNRSTGNDQRPTSQITATESPAVQMAANHGHGSDASGYSACANTGAYRYAPIRYGFEFEYVNPSRVAQYVCMSSTHGVHGETANSRRNTATTATTMNRSRPSRWRIRSSTGAGRRASSASTGSSTTRLRGRDGAVWIIAVRK